MNQMKAGAILSYVSLFITLTITLVYTPIMIRLIGQSEYGLYSLIGSLAAYFSIVDLGLGNTIVRYISRNRVLGNKVIEAELNGFFLKIYLFIGLLAGFLGLGIWLNLDTVFGESLTVDELDKARLMVLILIINFALSFPLSIFSSILQAYEKFIIVKMAAIVRSLLIPIITLPVLFLGYGSVEMVIVTTFVNIAVFLYKAWFVFRKLDIKFKFVKQESGFIKEIFGFSFFIFLNVIVDLMYWNTDQFILGITSGTEIVAIYAIAMQFIVMYKMFSTSISNLFLPKASRLVAKESNLKEISELMVKYGRLQFIILSFILSGFIVFGYQFISAWAGERYIHAYYIVLIIMIPLTIPLTQNFGIAILQAKNKQAFRAITYLIIALINVALSIPLAIKYGGIGIAVATALSLILGHIIIMNIYYEKAIRIDMRSYWINIFKISSVVSLTTFIGFSIDRYLFDSIDISFLIMRISIFSLIFITSLWLFVFNNYEQSLVKSLCFKLIKRNLKQHKN